MGLLEAKKYIQALHKKQDNPYLWPDYLTGLPDKAAIIKKLGEAFPRLGEYTIAYIRIANVHPYLIKYGSDRHAEIIQWAAAILQTTSKKCRGSFIGTLSTHDFIAICKTRSMETLFKEADKIFSKKIESFYTKEDLQKKITLSFRKNGNELVNIGLIKLIAVVADRKLGIKNSSLIQEMGRVCEALESSGEDIIFMTEEMACKN